MTDASDMHAQSEGTIYRPPGTTKPRIGLVAIALIVAVTLAVEQCANRAYVAWKELDATRDSDRHPLRGANGAFVSVHLHYERNYDNAAALQYRDQVSEKLRHAGIPVVPFSAVVSLFDKSTGPGHLIIIVRVTDAQSLAQPGAIEPDLAGRMFVSVMARFVESARLRRDPYYPLDAPTWSSEGFHVVDADTTCTALCALADPCVDRFVTEYLQANADHRRDRPRGSTGQANSDDSP